MPNPHGSTIRRSLFVSLLCLTIPAIASAQTGGLSATSSIFGIAPLGSLQKTPDPTLWEDARHDSHEFSLLKAQARAESLLLASRAQTAARVAPKKAPTQIDQSGTPGIGTFTGSVHADWYAIAACESSGRWDLNSGNGYWGGLQFAPSTWFAYGGGSFGGVGPFPYSAGEQIAVAERVLAAQGPGAWPSCFQST